jgi:hypothetical protein
MWCDLWLCHGDRLYAVRSHLMSAGEKKERGSCPTVVRIHADGPWEIEGMVEHTAIRSYSNKILRAISSLVKRSNLL